LTLLAESFDLAPVRLLLLARSSGEWLNELERRHPDVLERIVRIRLGGLAPINGDKTSAFRTAVRSYVADDALPSVYPDHVWSAIAEGIAPPADIEAPVYDSPLTLQLIALTSLLRRAQIISTDLSDTPEGRLLAHEECYWRDSAHAAGLPFGASYQMRLL